MKTAGLASLAAVAGDMTRFLAAMGAVDAFSSNTHDKSMEAAMTGAFVVGPLMAIVAVIVVLIYRSRRA